MQAVRGLTRLDMWLQLRLAARLSHVLAQIYDLLGRGRVVASMHMGQLRLLLKKVGGSWLLLDLEPWLLGSVFARHGVGSGVGRIRHLEIAAFVTCIVVAVVCQIHELLFL